MIYGRNGRLYNPLPSYLFLDKCSRGTRGPDQLIIKVPADKSFKFYSRLVLVFPARFISKKEIMES